MLSSTESFWEFLWLNYWVSIFLTSNYSPSSSITSFMLTWYFLYSLDPIEFRSFSFIFLIFSSMNVDWGVYFSCDSGVYRVSLSVFCCSPGKFGSLSSNSYAIWEYFASFSSIFQLLNFDLFSSPSKFSNYYTASFYPFPKPPKFPLRPLLYAEYGFLKYFWSSVLPFDPASLLLGVKYFPSPFLCFYNELALGFSDFICSEFPEVIDWGVDGWFPPFFFIYKCFSGVNAVFFTKPGFVNFPFSSIVMIFTQSLASWVEVI